MFVTKVHILILHTPHKLTFKTINQKYLAERYKSVDKKKYIPHHIVVSPESHATYIIKLVFCVNTFILKLLIILIFSVHLMAPTFYHHSTSFFF